MDLPKLNDARRIARMALVLDEIYNAKDSNEPFDMSAFEFEMCGGKKNNNVMMIGASDVRYSIYRQLVYATRDVKAYLVRQRFPSSGAVSKAKTCFSFHDATERDEKLDESMKTKDFNSVLRLMLILQKCRKNIKKHSNHSDVRRFVRSSVLSYDEFLLCGGKKKRKRDDITNRFDFFQQFQYAVQDMKRFLDRGRMPPPCVLVKAYASIYDENDTSNSKSSYIDHSDEEDVDCIDGGASYDDENAQMKTGASDHEEEYSDYDEEEHESDNGEVVD